MVTSVKKEEVTKEDEEREGSIKRTTYTLREVILLSRGQGNMKRGLLILVLLLIFSQGVYSSYDEAFMFYQHGLVDEAKAMLIQVIFGDTFNDDEKSAAYYLLGSIAFGEDRVEVALERWQDLLGKYPHSQEALLVEQRILELAELVVDLERETVDDIVARSYLGHGDFWSRGKSTSFSIDSSWIPKVPAAIKWFDKVVEEFPYTSASRIAFEKKLQTLLGWKDPGTYGRSHGIKESFHGYMPQLLETFYHFEEMHPEATTLQAFRYQIAQVYWNQKDWSSTREWLNKIIERAGEVDSYYKDLAERRLLKVEY